MCVFLAGTFVLSTTASAETLVLRDGSRVTGRLTLCDEEVCVMSSKRVPVETIERIELTGNVEAPAGAKDGSIVLADGTIHDGRFLGLNLGVVDSENSEIDRDRVALIVVKAAETPPEKDEPVPVSPTRAAAEVPAELPMELPEPCNAARAGTDRLRAALEEALPAAAKTAAGQYAANTDPGVDAVKAWGDFAAAALLDENTTLAAWAGLKAVEIRWSGETVANAGIYLSHLGRTTEALQLLNCSYAMSYRSPFLLEALAVVHQSLGNTAEARRTVAEAQELEPDDIIIATSAAFITTGRPPQAQPARTVDTLDESVRELVEHGQRALNLIGQQAGLTERSAPGKGGAEHGRIAAQLINNLLTIARDQLAAVRAEEGDPANRRGKINGFLQGLLHSHGLISDTLLSFPDATNTAGSPILLWAETLGLDAPILGREVRESGWTLYGAPLAQGAMDEYTQKTRAGAQRHGEAYYACPSSSDECRIREDARWCGEWKGYYEEWKAATEQRHDTAARGFDRVATRRLIAAENEWLRVRDYALRQLRKMTFWKVPGFDMEQMAVQTANVSIELVYKRHVMGGDDFSTGTIAYLRGAADAFQDGRNAAMEGVAGEAEQIRLQCQPVMQALMELLAQQEWQAYLEHLRERMLYNIDLRTEPGDCPPGKLKIGPLTVTADPNNLGDGKFDLKFEKGPVSTTATATVSDGGVALSADADANIKGVTIGVNSAGESSVTLPSSATVRYGPFRGKGKVTLTSKRNPYNSREYLGIKLKGSAGFGLGRRASAECYPSSGSVTIYPRAILQDAARYLSAPSSRPGS